MSKKKKEKKRKKMNCLFIHSILKLINYKEEDAEEEKKRNGVKTRSWSILDKFPGFFYLQGERERERESRDECMRRELHTEWLQSD